MPGAAAVWASAVRRGSRPASRRPKSRTYTNQNDATTRIGGSGISSVANQSPGSNAVASTMIANSKTTLRTRIPSGRVV